MKKTPLLLLLAAMMLTSCGAGGQKPEQPDNPGGGDIVDPGNPDPNPGTPDPENPDPDPGTPDPDPEPDIPTPTYETMTVAQIKEKAATIEYTPNERGIYVSDVYVKLNNVRCLARLDDIASSKGYISRYKLLCYDQTGLMYVDVDFDTYDYNERFIDENPYYDFQGKIAFHNGKVEVAEDRLFVKNNRNPSTTYDIDLEPIASKKTINEYFDIAESLKLNGKGYNFSYDLIQLDVKYIQSNIDSKIGIAGVGNQSVILYGSSNLKKQFMKDNSYTVTGIVELSSYRPAIIVLDSKKLETEVAVDYSTCETMTAEDFYLYKYEKEKDNPKYTNLFRKAFKVSGYANVYGTESSPDYYVFGSEMKEDRFSSKENAYKAKNIFFANNECNGIVTGPDVTNCPLYPSWVESQRVELVVFPYMYNTNGYFEVFLYSIDGVDTAK